VSDSAASRAELVMIVIEQILCPVDFSPFSERALRYAAALAAWYEAALTVLSVQSRPLLTTRSRPGEVASDGGQYLL
jgi:nucleotide-binding universal stress UspA family protein